jgi:hypothetical protein
VNSIAVRWDLRQNAGPIARGHIQNLTHYMVDASVIQSLAHGEHVQISGSFACIYEYCQQQAFVHFERMYENVQYQTFDSLEGIYYKCSKRTMYSLSMHLWRLPATGILSI